MNSWIVAALAATQVLLTGAPLDAQDGRIEGTVVVGRTPVDDAEITLTGQGRRVRTDGDGRFVLEGIPPGQYVVEAESPRWGRAVETVRVVAGRTTPVELSLEAVFHLDEMVVSAGAGATRRSEAYQPASVVTNRELVVLGQATLGETLSREPGVSSTYFGPGASRPVIRGIGGDRVRILEGGVGVGDASSTSPDHAVGIETRTAERIEVIRGPATLLYGSSAVGGVVNVLDGKIAREPPTEVVSGFVEGLAGSVADERTGAASLTATAGRVVLHASGLLRDASDYSIPGFAEAGGGDRAGESRGRLENSALENRAGSLGLTYVAQDGFLGVAWTEQRSDYGVPGEGHEEEGDEGHEEEGDPVTIDLDQSRFDVEGALRFRGPIRNVKARVGVADYGHVELEGEEVGTSFENDFIEGRVESEHEISERLRGAVGAQYAARDFRADGDEAFVPPSETRTFAVFGYEEFEVSERLRLQGGLRVERQTAGQPGDASLDRTDSGVSFSTGMSWDATDHLSLAASTSRSIKFPNAEELFSNGPHAATRAYEIGNPVLDEEVALGVDLTAHMHGERVRGSTSLFTTSFGDYIHESATGEVRDGLD
ncbi:MAG: TonB-dependent receptor, partial [Gemmatimonadetes bacterium]|nr:TonB-dependent receptor [Gemmatimonadota bacterium]